jgi:hypothetical protein
MMCQNENYREAVQKNIDKYLSLYRANPSVGVDFEIF